MFEMFPNIDIGKDAQYPLSSYLFGHRMRSNQTDIEYLIEFLQVMLAKKKLEDMTDEYFPKIPRGQDREIEYYPEAAIVLKRFIFFPNSKPEGKLPVDKDAYQACIKSLVQNVDGDDNRSKQIVAIIQDLFYGFNATAQNRSWFDKNMLPICPEVILPEGMGVKSRNENEDRGRLVFERGNAAVDNKFSYNRYTYMCRGGEIYYLHLLSSANQQDDAFRAKLGSRFKALICDSYPQFSELSKFIKNTWANYMMVEPDDVTIPKKNLNMIPRAFSCRDAYTAKEVYTLLSNNIDPFDKLNILADTIILQLLRVMFAAASAVVKNRKAPWVIDVSQHNPEMRKLAVDGFSSNEACVVDYIYMGYAHYEDRLKAPRGSSTKTKEQKHVDDAASDSYKLFRKLAKNLGLLVPIKGPNMRLSLNERLVKVLVLTLIGPGQKVTVDYFMELLYEHFGMIVDRNAYECAIEEGIMSPLSDYTFMDRNRDAFTKLLKECGFLRDLSDATCIVENPFDEEVISE